MAECQKVVSAMGLADGVTGLMDVVGKSVAGRHEILNCAGLQAEVTKRLNYFSGTRKPMWW
jgi:hypothetical protein